MSCRYYAVVAGKVPGVYHTWNECREQVLNVKGARFKAFDTLEEANTFITNGGIINATPEVNVKPPPVPHKNKRLRSEQNEAKNQDSDTEKLPTGWYLLKCDGGCRNPSLGAGGAVLWNHEHKVIFEQGILLNDAVTNNVAEYTGVLLGLRLALQHSVKKIRVQLDSKLIVMQVKGEWQINAEHLIPLYKQVKQLQSQFEEFSIEHCYRECNTIADAVCNKIMDQHQNK